MQDDWKLSDNLTLNLGLRWDYDSEFEATENFAPRVGASWSVTPKTVVRANFGIYYDQFRLGLARNVPAFGGTDQRNVQYLVFPRGFYGSPSFVSSIALLSGLPGGCFSNNLVGNLTDAQIAAGGSAVLSAGGVAADRRGSAQQRGGRRPLADSGQHGDYRRQRPDPDGADGAAVRGSGERGDRTADRIFRLRSDWLVDQCDHSGAASSDRGR